MWNVNEVKRVKISRVLKILRNVVNHFENKHEFVSFKDWEVDVRMTDNGLTIDMKSEQFGQTLTAWEEHKKYIRKALRKKQRHNIKEHSF